MKYGIVVGFAFVLLILLSTVFIISSVKPSAAVQQDDLVDPDISSEQERVSATQKVASGLKFPSAIVLAPDGKIFFNELKTGKIKVMQDGVLQRVAYVKLTSVATAGEQGMLGLAVHPDFQNNPFIYLYHTYQNENDEVFNRIVRFTDSTSAGKSKGVEMEVILDRIPAGVIHNGGILVFGPDDKLYASTGDTGQSQLAQDLTSLGGKILRINPDGSIPNDNPFVDSFIFSYGHRNVFGLDFHPVNGKLFASENGPRDSDEINIIVPGGNYGWPVVRGIANDPMFIDPILSYTPVIAPTNMAFNSGDKYCNQENVLFLGDFNSNALHRLVLKPPEFREVLSDDIIKRFNKPVIDVELSPDGFIHVSTTTKIVKIKGAIGSPCPS